MSMEITIKLDAPELAAAINNLASSLAGQTHSKSNGTKAKTENAKLAEVQPAAANTPDSFSTYPIQSYAQPGLSAPVSDPIPALANATPYPQQAPAGPVPSPAPIAIPVVTPVYAPGSSVPVAGPAPSPAPAAVPTAAQTYTVEQLAVAATQLVDAGRREDVVKLNAQFGVQALTQLSKEYYGAYATELRKLGAKI